jgi:hypothetical protein
MYFPGTDADAAFFECNDALWLGRVPADSVMTSGSSYVWLAMEGAHVGCVRVAGFYANSNRPFVARELCMLQFAVLQWISESRASTVVFTG